MNSLDIQRITSQSTKLLNQIENLDDRFSIYELTTGLQIAHRTQSFTKICEMKDIFTSHWMLWIGNVPSNSVYLKNKGQWVELAGPCALYIPPFSMLQWKINPGTYDWVGLSWESELKKLPEISCVFPWNFKFRVNSIYDLHRVILSTTDRIEIYHEDFSSAVSSKVKEYIDKNYSKPLKLEEIAKHLRIPHSTITHYFKKSFGLSPVEYRKRLRSAESLRLLIGGKQVPKQAIINTGFEDYSRFYRSIKATYGSSPNKYSTR